MDIKAFYKLTYGMYVIGSKNGENINGYVANTAFQVSADPPLIAVSCHKNNFSASTVSGGGVFSISVLEKDPDPGVIGRFGYKSGKDIDKFDGMNLKTDVTGAPILLDNTIAYFECEVVDTFDVGTHLLFIGKVVNSVLIDENKEPLTYERYQNVFKGKAPKNAPTFTGDDKEQKKKVEEADDYGPKYECLVCGYVYDPVAGDEAQGIPPGTPFDRLPDDWVCPVCAAAKSDFVSLN